MGESSIVRALVVALLAATPGCYLSHRAETPAEPPPESDCPAALQLGAPAPMPGYCPTRERRSVYPIPERVPESRWVLDLPVEVGTQRPIVVGPRGRIYLPAGGQLLAVDDLGAEGRLAWMVEVGGAFRGPFLLRDGSLLLVAFAPPDDTEAIWLDAAGAVTQRVPLEGRTTDAAVDARGGIVRSVRTEDDRAVIVRHDADGAVDWRSAPFEHAWARFALGRAGEVFVGEAAGSFDPGPATLTALDGETGDPRWAVELDPEAQLTGGPSVGSDGAVRAVLWTDGSTTTTLATVGPDGELRRAALPEEPWGGGVHGLSVAADGTAYVKEGRALMAVAPGGEIRWQRDAHPNIDLGTTLDPDGALLIGGGGHTRLDGADGAERWVSAIEAHSEPTPGGGVRIHFPGVATVGDGVLYYMASDARLQAVGPPR